IGFISNSPKLSWLPFGVSSIRRDGSQAAPVHFAFLNLLRFLRLASSLALRDLRGGPGSLRLLVTGVAIGVAAIAATGSISAGIAQAVRQDAQTAIGGDISLRLFHEAASSEQRRFLSAIGRYSEIAEL